MSKLLQVGCALILSVMAAAAQDPPSFYAFGKFPAGAVYTEADLKGLVDRELPSPSYLESRFVCLGFIKGRQLFSTFRPGIIDPNGIAFGNVLMAVAFHDNAPPGLEVGKVIVSTPNGPGAPGSSPGSRAVPVFWPPCDWGLSAGIRVDMPGAVKEGLPPVIKRLLTWRKRNNLSRRGALEVMKERGLVVSMSTLTAWEQGARSPGSYSTQLLVAFLRQHPRIENPPYYPPGPPPGFRDRR
jgi:hypothetical protein